MSHSNEKTWTPAIGDQVFVNDPDGYVADLRSKIKNGRVGEIVKLQDGDPNFAYVRFPGGGRRKELRHAFRLSALSLAPTTEAEPKPKAAKP